MTRTSYIRLVAFCFGTCLAVLMNSLSVAVAQDEAASRRVQGIGAAGGAEVQINQIDTSGYPKVSIFAAVSRGGEPVLGLNAQDFRVKEDEVDQEPLTVAPKVSPLTAVVTIDTSGSIRKALPEVQKAAKIFLDQLGTADRFQIVTFSREVKVLGTVASREQAKTEIDRTVARGDTALYDAIFQSVNLLRDVKGRRAVVLLTDGVDDDGQGKQLSTHSVEQALALAAELNVPLFTIGLGQEKDVTTLERVASATGGRFFDATQADALQQIYTSLGKQLSGQYAINYTSNLPADGTSRRLALVQGENRGFKDYLAPKSTTAVVTAAPTTTEMVKSSGGEPKLVVVVALRADQEPIKFDSVEIFDAQDAIDEKSRKKCIYDPICEATVAAGSYRITAKVGDASVSEIVDYKADGPHKVKLALNAGKIEVKALASEGGEEVKFDSADLISAESLSGDSFDAGKLTSKCLYEKACVFIAPAGDYTLRMKKGEAEAKAEVKVSAGELTRASVTLNAGMLVTHAAAVDGGEAIKADAFEVWGEAGGLEAERQKLAGCLYEQECTFTLAAGRYTLFAKKGAATAEKPVEITAGKRTTETVSLNAGLITVKAVGGVGNAPIKLDSITILQASTSMEPGDLKIAGCIQENTCSFTLPSGSYRVRGERRGQDPIEKEVTVTAGQRGDVEFSFGG